MLIAVTTAGKFLADRGALRFIGYHPDRHPAILSPGLRARSGPDPRPSSADPGRAPRHAPEPRQLPPKTAGSSRRPVGVEVARPGSPAAGRLSVRCRGRSSSWTGSCGRPISCAGFRSPTDLAETVAGVVHIASNVSCPARARRRGLRRVSRTGPPLIWADLWHPNAVLAARDPGAAAPMLWRGTSQSRRRESDGEVLLVPHFGRG